MLWRKRSFGTRSERGDRFAERIMTVVRTRTKARPRRARISGPEHQGKPRRNRSTEAARRRSGLISPCPRRSGSRRDSSGSNAAGPRCARGPSTSASPSGAVGSAPRRPSSASATIDAPGWARTTSQSASDTSASSPVVRRLALVGGCEKALFLPRVGRPAAERTNARSTACCAAARTPATYEPISDSIAPANSTVVLGVFIRPDSHAGAGAFKPPREHLPNCDHWPCAIGNLGAPAFCNRPNRMNTNASALAFVSLDFKTCWIA